MKSKSRRYRLFFLLPLFFVFANGASADPVSVYQVDPKIDGAVIGLAAAANLLPTIFAGDLITRRCPPCDPGEVNAFDRGAIGNHDAFSDVTSHITVGFAMIGPVVANAYDLGLTQPFWEDFVVFSQTLLVTGALVTAAKYITQRPLPVVYSGHDPSLLDAPGGYRSFFSGHTATAFAALSAASMTLHYRHQAGAWPWIVTAVLGTSVAVERVLAGRHFPSDVIVGAVVGTGIGILIPWLHHRSSEGQVPFAAAPSPGGLTLIARF